MDELSAKKPAEKDQKRGEVLRLLEDAPTDKQYELLITRLQDEVSKVLMLEPSMLPDPGQGFSDMGMDSLTAVELKNQLEAGLGHELPPTLAFNYPNIEILARYLLNDVLFVKTPGLPGQVLQETRDKLEVSEEEIRQLSEDDASALIAKEFEELAGA